MGKTTRLYFEDKFLMLFSENRCLFQELSSILCGKNSLLLNVKYGVRYSYRCTLKDSVNCG
jgi:hypothetical protein